MPKRSIRSPRTKAELLDKIMSYSFTGDLRNLAPDPSQAVIRRTRQNAIELDFHDTDSHFEIVVRKPRGPESMQGSHAAGSQSQGGGKKKKRGRNPPRSNPAAE